MRFQKKLPAAFLSVLLVICLAVSAFAMESLPFADEDYLREDFSYDSYRSYVTAATSKNNIWSWPEGTLVVGAKPSVDPPRTMTEVTLPKSTEIIALGALNGLRGVTAINFDELTSLKLIDACSVGYTQIGTLDLSNTKVVKIGWGAFGSSAKLYQVIMPSTLKVIEHNAFENCPHLSIVTLNDGLERIESYAFSYSTALLPITLPASLTYIADDAFSGNVTFKVAAESYAEQWCQKNGRTYITIGSAVTPSPEPEEPVTLPALPNSKTIKIGTHYDAAYHTLDSTLTFSEVVSDKIQVGAQSQPVRVFTLRKGGQLRCDQANGYIALDIGNGQWYTYDGEHDAAFLAGYGIKVLPTEFLQRESWSNSQYAAGYAWQFNQVGTFTLQAGCGDSDDSLYFTVKVEEETVPSTPSFTDVKADAYYAEPVKWAVDNGVTAGTTATTFSPNATCTNAQILTFMWRAAGSPEPAIASPFTNLSGSEYYAKAAVWAYEKGMVAGTSFDSGTACTRAMTMEYFWKQAGSPETAVSDKFADVSAGSSYAQAVAWAVENGVTAGTSETTFSPDNTCTRAQIVTFLHRALV